MGRGSRTMHSRLLLPHPFSLFTASFFLSSTSFIDHTVQLTIFSFIHTLNHGAIPIFCLLCPSCFDSKVPFRIVSYHFLLPPFLLSTLPFPPLFLLPHFVSVTLPSAAPPGVIRRIHPWNFALVRKSEGASPLPLLPPLSLSTQTGN